jgi:hypothetical protein
MQPGYSFRRVASRRGPAPSWCIGQRGLWGGQHREPDNSSEEPSLLLPFSFVEKFAELVERKDLVKMLIRLMAAARLDRSDLFIEWRRPS